MFLLFEVKRVLYPQLAQAKTSVCNPQFDAINRYLYDCKVMSDKLPSLIDPILLAERRSVVSGAIEIAELPRLKDLLFGSPSGLVNIVLNFGKEGKRPVVEGHAQATPVLACQTCMEALPWPLDVHFRLGVITTLDEVDGLEIDCEPLLYQGEKLVFNDLIEDELLLAIPDYPKHDFDCILQSAVEHADIKPEVVDEPRQNPFSVLANLKKAGD